MKFCTTTLVLNRTTTMPTVSTILDIGFACIMSLASSPRGMWISYATAIDDLHSSIPLGTAINKAI